MFTPWNQLFHWGEICNLFHVGPAPSCPMECEVLFLQGEMRLTPWNQLFHWGEMRSLFNWGLPCRETDFHPSWWNQLFHWKGHEGLIW